ncbi:MAG: Fic family protein [Gemmatimonadales bacterium]
MKTSSAEPGSTRAGRFVRQQTGPEGYAAFIPAPLPPEPPLVFDPELREALERASHALGRLDGVSASLDPDLLLYMYVRKEAVLSSQIEGTQSTLTDLLQYENAEAPGVPEEDVREVSRYCAALQHGLVRLRGGLPLCLRLRREVHGVLLTEARGGHQAPGEFRRSQNWVGGSRPGKARFVPPPPHEMLAALDNLEKFLHDEPERTPPLIKAGLAHVQFETIHPFLDGNGRIGRLLITLLLCMEGVLSQPFLYLSLYFKQNRADYYDALQRVRTHGDWESWLRFYLSGVEEVATQATATARALLSLFETDRARVRKVGRGAASALSVYDHLRRKIIVSIPRTAEATGLSRPTVTAALERLSGLDITREITGKARDRQFVYSNQLAVLDKGIGG